MKTITLFKRNDPVYVLCPGKVTATEFNKAHKKEGWIGDWIPKASLKTAYWKRSQHGNWRLTGQKEKKGTKLFTYCRWD